MAEKRLDGFLGAITNGCTAEDNNPLAWLGISLSFFNMGNLYPFNNLTGYGSYDMPCTSERVGYFVQYEQDVPEVIGAGDVIRSDGGRMRELLPYLVSVSAVVRLAGIEELATLSRRGTLRHRPLDRDRSEDQDSLLAGGP